MPARQYVGSAITQNSHGELDHEGTKAQRCVRSFPTALAVVLVAAFTVFPASAQLLPDLVITNIETIPVNPGAGQTFLVRVSAYNYGKAIPVQETYMHVWYDITASGPPPSCLTSDASQPLLIAFPPGEIRIFEFEVTYPLPGDYQFHAWVDACNLIEEYTENDNQMTQTISVGNGDLTIESIVPSVADPVPGQSFDLNVTVRNTGPYIEGLWSCGVIYQQAEPQTCTFDQLEQRVYFPANSTHVITFGPVQYGTGGTYPVWAWVNCDENVPEADYSNNKLFYEIVIGQPDLVIDSVTPSNSTPNVNQQINVDVTVRNAGSAAAGAFRLSIKPHDASTPTGDGCALTDYQEVTSGLAVGASVTKTFQVSYSAAASRRFWAWADSCNAVAEAREDNNKASVNIVVADPTPGLPDLIVQSITPTEIFDANYGQVVWFDVVVKNVGTVASGAFRVGDFEPAQFPGSFPSYVVIGNPGPSQGGGSATISDWSNCGWRAREVSSLAPGATATVQFWHHYWVADTYPFTATADACGTAPNHAVVESTEQNNTLTIEFDVTGCDADADRDGVCDADDFCPTTADPLNNDSDGDGLGDVCDDDDDNDGVPDPNDCEPRNRFIFPGATEDCTDGIDNNCDGQIDEGAADWYRDADGDGYGDAGDLVHDCGPFVGFVENADDCDDTNALVHPGANGPCDDGVDNDCDGTIDNEATVWGRDTDADGFTDSSDVIVDDDGVCDGQPAGYSLLSDVDDPDDDDFMVPEPVTGRPIDISRPRTGRPVPATLTLQRNGQEAYRFAVDPNSVPDWLTLDPMEGTSSAGVAEITATPDAAGLALSRYEATIAILINGRATVEVPVGLQVRNPILTVRHAGLGGGSAWVEYDAEPNDPTNDYTNDLLFDTTGGTYEGTVEIPEGRSGFLRAYTEGDCSFVRGIYDESGTAINDPNSFYWEANEPCFGCTTHPVWVRMDGDREITVRYSLSGYACTACGFGSLGLTAFLAFTGRPRRRQ